MRESSKRKRNLPDGVEEQAPTKVAWSKERNQTLSDGCTKQAKNGGVCLKHGATRTECKHEGCNNHALKGGVCIKHGAKVKRCSSEGCTSQARRGGVCIKHGAKVIHYICSSEGCEAWSKSKTMQQ